MRMRSVSVAAMAMLAGSLSLTACGPDNSGGNGASSAPSSSNSSSASSAPGTNAPTANGSSGRHTGTGSTANASGVERCHASDVSITILASDHHATTGGPATGTVHVVNVSGHSCTLKGFPGLKVSDDHDGAQPITARRQSTSPNPLVKLAPKKAANAALEYDNTNFEGSPSGRFACGVEAHSADVILPNETQTVKAPVSGGIDNGTLNMCGSDAQVSAFHAAE
ncbi:DUF4232 domain-containing protein [Streptomyces sp. NPDC054933]|jgi:hypothetical protein